MHRRAEIIRNHAISAGRNDVDFVRWIPAVQPIGITEHFRRPEDVEGPHWGDGNDQNVNRTSTRRGIICVAEIYVSSGCLTSPHTALQTHVSEVAECASWLKNISARFGT